MQISLVGISHKTAPVSVREHFAFASEELPAVLARLGKRDTGVAVLSTCNRTEVYIADAHGIDDPRPVIAALSDVKGEPPAEGAPFFTLSSKEAARHLFRVAAGIESMVIGESEILGQVRSAFAASTVAGTHTVALSRLFHSAIRVGRRARSQTGIGRHAVSISSTAVALARSTFGELAGKTVLVVSAGEAGKLTARTLSQSGVGRMLVTSRNAERAAELAHDLDGEIIPFKRLADAVGDADIVITSTASSEFVLHHEMVASSLVGRSLRPLLIIDIAVPRDVEPSVREVPGVRLYDIDDLQEVARANMHLRRAEVANVERIVEDEVARFSAWIQSLEVIPTITSIRSHAESMRVDQLQRTLARTQMSAADRKRVDAMTSAIVKKLLHAPISRLKARGDGERYLQAARALFDLDDPPERKRRPTDDGDNGRRAKD